MNSILTLVLAGGGGGIGVLIGAYVSLRMLKTNNANVVAKTQQIVGSDRDGLLQRYEKVVSAQDLQLTVCRERIDELERREAECERRAREVEDRARNAEQRAERANEHAAGLVARVKHLEDVLRLHGLNGD